MIAQGNGERREKPERTALLCFLESAFAGGGSYRSQWPGYFPHLPPKLVSCFPLGPHLFGYLPQHLLLLFIVYLPNEGGGVDWRLIDSYKPSQSGQRAVGFGFKSALNVRFGPVLLNETAAHLKEIIRPAKIRKYIIGA